MSDPIVNLTGIGTAVADKPDVKIRPFPGKRRRWRLGSAILIAVLLMGGAAVGIVTDRALSRRTAPTAESVPGYGAPAKSGPWGDLYAVPFNISAPEEALPVKNAEEGGTHWILKDLTRESFEKLLLRADASAGERASLLDASVLHEAQGAIELAPPADLVLALSPAVRQAIYQAATQLKENRSQFFFIRKDSLHDRFDGSGLADSTVRMFHQLCWQNGDNLVFSGMAALLSRLPTYLEKSRFMKAMTSQRTLMLHLHVKPDSDVEALARYWGRGCWSTDIRTILHSVAQSTGGAWINILMVLPPTPASELYFFPIVQDNPMNGPTVTRDCHWSSLNFFRDTPDPNFARADYVTEQFKSNYYPIFADPRYGDLLLLGRPDGSIVHSAIFIADDIVFTKNGATALNPWMLSTVADLLKYYSCEVGPAEKLKVAYYRNKAL